jgi:DNA-binding beta-propeller fold protein YncE
MKTLFQNPRGLLAAALGLSALIGFAHSALAADKEAAPYKILATTKIPAAGGIDYVTADSLNRRVYVACGKAVSVFDLDTYKLAGTLANASGHGVAIDPENQTGLVSGNPATFFNTKTLEAIKTIPAPGADGYIFDAPTHHFFILSHRAPNLLVVDSRDGSTVGKVEAIGPDGANAAVEQGATDGEGHLYFDVANAHHIAVVDAKTLKVTGHFDLGEKGNGPAGLAIDTKNHILFAMCRGGRGGGGTPTCVILSSADGKIITTLPLAGSSDGATFNPRTMEAFSSHGNGTLSVIKENSPMEFVPEETVQTKAGAKTCTLDTTTDHVIVITREAAPAAPGAAPATVPATGGGRRGGRGGPQTLDVIFIGR